MNKWLIVTTLIGAVLCQDSVSDINDLTLENINKLPGLENFNQSSLPNKEDVEKVLREKCEKNGGPSAFDDIVNSKDDVQKCFEKFINTTVLMEELDEAKKDGSMDEVFGKYCKQKNQMLDCVKDVTKKIENCLEQEEKSNLKMAMNVSESLIDFMCFKDGDRLAMFVAQGGFECLKESKEDLQQCANSTLKNRIPSDLSITNLPMLVFKENECRDMNELKLCVVSVLEKCEDNTPANIVEALFKFIKKSTPCSSYTYEPENAHKFRMLSDDSNSVVMDKVKRSQQYQFSFIESFSEKCRKYAGPMAYADLEASVNNLKVCVQAHLRQPNCARMPNEIRNCTKQVINKLRICLPPQESYLPSFAHDSVNSVLHYVCSDNGKNFTKFIYSGGLPCLLSNDPKSLNDCLSGTKTRRTTDNDVILKTELCEDLNKIQLCLSTYINNHCSDIKDFKEVSMGLVEAFKAPCSGCSIFINNTLIFIALLALKKLLN